MTTNNAAVYSRLRLNQPDAFTTLTGNLVADGSTGYFAPQNGTISTLAGTITAQGYVGYFAPQNGTISTLAGTITANGTLSTWYATILSGVNITPKLTINNTDLTTTTLDNARITNGRDSLSTQPQPSYCTFQLIGSTQAGPELLGRLATLTLGGTAIFAGAITDVKISTLATRPDWEPVHTITAVGRLRDLNKPVKPLAAATDSERIAQILRETLATQWQRTTGTWTDQIHTWDYANSDGIANGLYALAATTDTTNGYELATQAANDALGVISDTAQNGIAYQSAQTRNKTYYDTFAATLNVALFVDVAAIQAETQSGDVINTVTVTYVNGSATAQDINSATTYGTQSAEIRTNLTSSSQAQDRAQMTVNRYAQPRQHLSSIDIPLNLCDLQAKANLVNVYVGMPIRLTNLPPLLGGQADVWRGYVEGWSWNISKTDTWITLNISEYSLSTMSERWSEKDTTLTWASVTTGYYWYNI